MGIQLSLLLDPLPHAPTVEGERAEPAVWIRRLWVLRELSPGDEHVVRCVELRRGLNVLWAAPTLATEENRLFQGKLTGHTAGKTTFCRLIRHVLGEPTFGTQAARHRIRAKFPTSWVVGEVYVAGELWTVARPLLVGPHPFAIRGGPLAAIFDGRERTDYPAFIEAIEAATVRGLPVTRLPHSDLPVRWEHLLPWLARDQESRFSNFIQWRDSTSESESPVLVVEDRHVLVRAVLDLISDQERAEQRTNAELVAAKQKAAERAPLLAHQAEVDRGRLAVLLGIEGHPVSEGPLFGDESRAIVASRRAALDANEAEAATEDHAPRLRTAWEAAVAARAEAAQLVREVEAQIAIERGASTQYGVAAGSGQMAMLTTLPPGRTFCNVPLVIARAEGCPLAATRHPGPSEARERRPRRGPEADAAQLAEAVAALDHELVRSRVALATATTAEEEAHRDVRAAEDELRESTARRARERAAVDQAEWLLARADETRRGAEGEEEELARLDKALRRSYERQESLRARHATALGKVSDRFSYVVRAILGDQVSGCLDDDGRHLALRVDEHGERESAAIATLKLLAFDLAALTASVEGDGFFPRFLLHDGPREADMDQTIYERLFLYARSLEQAFSGEPGFQYIVTTTAAPPVSMQRAPWLIEPVLDASTAEGRLLGVDL